MVILICDIWYQMNLNYIPCLMVTPSLSHPRKPRWTHGDTMLLGKQGGGGDQVKCCIISYRCHGKCYHSLHQKWHFGIKYIIYGWPLTYKQYHIQIKLSIESCMQQNYQHHWYNIGPNRYITRWTMDCVGLQLSTHNTTSKWQFQVDQLSDTMPFGMASIHSRICFNVNKDYVAFIAGFSTDSGVYGSHTKGHSVRPLVLKAVSF